MKKLLVLLLCLGCFHTYGQCYIRVHALRALLGEVQLSYEMPLKKEKNAIVYRLGFIYPLAVLQGQSALNSRFGMVGYIDGLNVGGMIGLAYKKEFGKKRRYFYQVGLDAKLLQMKHGEVIWAYETNVDRKTFVDVNHFILNPNL